MDAHKGDGTAEMTYRNDSIHTLSIHMGEAWPFGRKDRGDEPWYIPSNVDLPLGGGREKDYLDRLAWGLGQLKNQGSADVVVVVNGVDPWEGDKLPSTQSMRLTKQQMLERDRLVYEWIQLQGLPVTYLMSGGYGPRAHELYTQFLATVLT